MKALLLLLIALNAAFFFWQRERAPSAPDSRQAPPAAVEPGVERLKLLSELESPRARAHANCERVGPFSDEAQARTLREDLRAMGATAALGVETQSAFRVRSAPLATRALADALAARLAGSGVGDVQIVPVGDAQFALALGVYAERDAAARRREHLATLDVVAEVQPQDIVQRDYWVMLTPPPPAADWWTAFATRLPAQRHERVRCPQPR
jgi:hypothetical protein